jgi:voltage-gated potassium channel
MKKNYRNKLYQIIFEADTLPGKAFDVALIFFILLSVIAVVLESIPSINQLYGSVLHSMEWVITIIFTLEYIVRIWASPKPWRYIFSFYGVIDFLAIIPTYLDLIFTGAMGFAVIRGLRLLRIFRILKITRYSREGQIIIDALHASRIKIFVFLFAVATIVIILGTVMYLVEGEASGFTSIPTGIYWAIVTLTTVGFGDITPITPLGKFIAGFVMILGYGIIAVPTSIVTYEVASSSIRRQNRKTCKECGFDQNDQDAKFCKECGAKL